MMNDRILNDMLAQWKTERAPEENAFSSEKDFEKRFFAEVKKEQRKLPRNRTSLLDRLAAALHNIRPSKSLSASPASEAEILYSRPAKPANFASSSIRPAAPLLCRTKGLVKAHACCSELSSCHGIGASPFDDADMGGNFPVFDTEEYKTVGERPFVPVTTNPLSTFGADVDSAMYSNVRRMVMEEHRLPPPEAVRLEEFINYFAYDYPTPEKDGLMRPHFELGKAPWAPERDLLLIGLQAKMPVKEELPLSHYVFLIDDSGSMDSVFPMVKEAMTVLAGALRKGDLVSMVTYGGGVEVLLEGCSDRETICKKIAGLEAGGYTPGGEGIQKAYALAEKHFIAGGNNRIVLITDGDFNVGASSEAELVGMVKAKRDTGIYLTIAGCGMGNYKDNKLKMLANKGNGNVFYLDTVREAKRVFLHGMTGNMYALARDVKFQIEFNPKQVFAYRLLGYELRDMTDRDFRDESKESGTVGLGQQMTALYEIIPADAEPSVKNAAVPEMPPLKYQSAGEKASEELLTFRIRYCPPQGKRTAKEESFALKTPLAHTENWGWASAVAEAGLALRHSRFAPDCALEHAAGEAQKFLGEDRSGERAEFLLLLRRASELAGKEKKGK